MTHKPSHSSSPTHYQLRSLVLDYLCHQCYPKTAARFAETSTVRNLDPDGDEIMAPVASTSSEEDASFMLSDGILNGAEIRKEIRIHLLSGRVDEATRLLERHFPFVLSETEQPSKQARLPDYKRMSYLPAVSVDPSHLNLNLRILAFTESCRTGPLPYAFDTAPSSAQFQPVPRDTLLPRARKLIASVQLLPSPEDRAIYEKELLNVCGLVAYPIPEESPLARYLTQERREAVADSVNAAILYRQGSNPIPFLELYTRHTSACWTSAAVLGAEPSANAVLPPNWPKKARKSTPAGEIPALEGPPFMLEQFISSSTQE